MNSNEQSPPMNPNEPEKSISPTVIQQLGDINFHSVPSPTNLFNQNTNNTNTNNNIQFAQPQPQPQSQSSPHSNIFTNQTNNKSIHEFQSSPTQSQSLKNSNIFTNSNNETFPSLQSEKQTKQITPPKPKPQIQTNTQTNQENINPNNENSNNSNSNTNTNKSESNSIKKKKQKQWKIEFNKLIRLGKSYENKKEYLNALHSYYKASKLSHKKQQKLFNKIEKLQDYCYDKNLHESEDAFKQINESDWYLNIVTDTVWLEREKKDDDDIENDSSFYDDDDDDDEGEYSLPANIFDKLYDYQKTCLEWFWKIFQSPCGGILGDDMGLGKTVQMSAFLHGLFFSGLTKSCLLIVPVSVMEHWIKELAVWCDVTGFVVKKYHSKVSKKRRENNLKLIAKRGGILITSYGMVQKNYASLDIQELTKKLTRDGKIIREGSKWDYMILDEGHKIKNHLIGTSKAVRQIPVTNSNKIILSGTFLQNELSELWSLFDFISEGSLFGSYRAFNQEFATKINAGRLKNASLIQKQLSNRLLNLIKKTVKPYLLRRTKAEIRQKQQDNNNANNNNNKKKLTPVLNCEKRELVIWIKMSSVQTEIYRTFLESEVVKETLNTTKSPLAALTVLKKICDHPFLLSDKMANCQELTQLAAITEDKSIRNTLRTSNKMGVLMHLVNELIDKNHRVLVFSQYKIILSMIEPIFKENKIRYLRMDGSTPIEDRQKFVEVFNKQDRFQIFLLSTRVGGLGLNLIGSDRVIIYDPAWNPATDAQAVDRSYRIGQLNDVMVYRFVTCGTIEEKIYRRQISKVGLLKSVTGKSNQHRYFSKAELKSVFKLENPECSQTQIQFKELGQHRIGTNAEFDREQLFVEHVQFVYGVSHHDLLFRTCPKEEIDENPQLAEQIEAVRKRVIVQTPRIRNTTKKNKKKEKINELLDGKLDLSNFIPTTVTTTRKKKKIVINNDHNKNKKAEDINFDRFRFDGNNNNNNNSNELVWEKSNSNSMDIDSDDGKNDGQNDGDIDIGNASFISNISSIQNNDESNNNSWNDLHNKINDSIKKRKTLKKTKNRFIDDSDTESDGNQSDDKNNQFPQSLRKVNNFNSFNFCNSNRNQNNNNNNNDRINNIIFQTPLFNRTLSKKMNNLNENENENDKIEMSDIRKVIRSQPKKKRRKSIANLQHLIDAQDSDKNEELNNDEIDSEATISEDENYNNIVSNGNNNNNEQNSSGNCSGNINSSFNERLSPENMSGFGNISSIDKIDNNNQSNISYNNNNILNDNNNKSQPMNNNNANNNENNPYFDNNFMNNVMEKFSPKQNKSFEKSHSNNKNNNKNNNNIHMSWNFNTNDKSNINKQSKSLINIKNNNQNNNIKWNFNKSSIQNNENNNNNNNNNISWNFNTTNLSNPNSINNSQNNNIQWNFNQSQTNQSNTNTTQTNNNNNFSDEEMFDLSNSNSESNNTLLPIPPPTPAPIRSESVTAQEIFDNNNIEQMDKKLNESNINNTPLNHVSPIKIKQLKKSYKKYRRQSFIPQIEEYDNINDDSETESENENENELNNNNNNNNNDSDINISKIMVCNKHKLQSQQVESFEYNCTKCECYLTQNEKNKYKMYIKLADDAEKQQDWGLALEMTMDALEICNQDVAIHTKCILIAENMQIATN